MKIAHILIVIALGLLLATGALAVGGKPVKPGGKDKCQVCGMFVAKYPDFAAQVHFKNGTLAHFDGAKDLFKYYHQIGRYNPKATSKDISALYVTDYYTLTPIDGFTATYIVGSDVFGPMGRELIPFAKAKDAQEFLKDHKGKKSLSFKEVTSALLKELD